MLPLDVVEKAAAQDVALVFARPETKKKRLAIMYNVRTLLILYVPCTMDDISRPMRKAFNSGKGGYNLLPIGASFEKAAAQDVVLFFRAA